MKRSAKTAASPLQVALVTLSTKHQITLPAAMVRALGLKPGDKLMVVLAEGHIALRPRPKSWVDYVSGSLKGYYGRSKEEVDAYLAEVRQGWGPLLAPLGEGHPSESS